MVLRLLDHCHLRHTVAVIEIFLGQPTVCILCEKLLTVIHLHALLTEILVVLYKFFDPLHIRVQDIIHRE
jgi:hypothetical protein